MMGGKVVVLGITGRNFAAGMSRDIAYVLNMAHRVNAKVNQQMVKLGKVTHPQEITEQRSLIEDHRHYPGSEIADRVLSDFQRMLQMSVRVMPHDFEQVLEQETARLKEGKKRMSTIDLVPSYTASKVNLASEAIEEVFSQKGLLTSVTPSSNPPLQARGPTQRERAQVSVRPMHGPWCALLPVRHCKRHSEVETVSCSRISGRMR